MARPSYRKSAGRAKASDLKRDTRLWPYHNVAAGLHAIAPVDSFHGLTLEASYLPDADSGEIGFEHPGHEGDEPSPRFLDQHHIGNRVFWIFGLLRSAFAIAACDLTD
jgi:hypothetical protein